MKMVRKLLSLLITQSGQFSLFLEGQHLMRKPLKNCPKIISRAEWGAEPPERREKMSEPTSYMVIHHTYIPGMCKTMEQCKKAMKSMQNHHKHKLKWGDIGYSFCIGGDGNIYEGRGWGVVGAHTIGWNHNSIGLCMIGDFRTELPTDRMIKLIDELTTCGINTGHLKKDVKYFGHRQVSPTECPGEKLYQYIKKLPRWIEPKYIKQ